MRSVDVVVVGAGPAGAAAAIELARGGRDVLVVDKARFPRDKCCGDGLTTAALRLLERLDVDPRPLPSFHPVDEAWVRSPSGREVCFPLPSGPGAGLFAAVVPRIELDALLLTSVRAAGAAVLEGQAVVAARQRTDRVEVDLHDGERITARYVIAADGMWSPTRKALGLAEPGYLGEWHAFRQYASGVTGPAADQLWIWFEPDLLPGYAWSFPLPSGRVNIGFGILRGGTTATKDMKRLWPDLLARPHVRAALGPDVVLEGTHKAWPIPARIDRTTIADRRALFVGDAAAATDPMTGEGIGQALLTGVLAAEAVLDAGALHPEIAAADYDRRARAELVADHRMSLVLAEALKRDRLARGAVKLAGRSDWTRRNFGRWLFEDEPRAVVLTPKRWHRGFLSRRGAFAD